jgi:hypothetical protein
MTDYAAYRFGRDAPARIATSVVMFDEANELLPEEPMYQPVIPFYPVISSGSGGVTTTDQNWTNYPGRCDLSFYQGDDVTVTLLIEDPSDDTPDMSTAWDWTAQIRVFHTYHSTLVNTFSVKDEYVPPTVDAVGYTAVTLFLPRADNIYAGTYNWDLYAKSPFTVTGLPEPDDWPEDDVWPPADQIRTWLYGEVSILPRVTSTDALPVPNVMAPGWSGPGAGVVVANSQGFVVGPNGRVP